MCLANLEQDDVSVPEVSRRSNARTALGTLIHIRRCSKAIGVCLGVFQQPNHGDLDSVLAKYLRAGSLPKKVKKTIK